MLLLAMLVVVWMAIALTSGWIIRREKRFMSEFAAAIGFPEDPMTSDTVHASYARRQLIPLPVLAVVWIVLVFAAVNVLGPVTSHADTWVGDLLIMTAMLMIVFVVFVLPVRLHVVFWSADRVVFVAARFGGRIVRVLTDAYCSQCRAEILPSLLGVRYLLETPDGSWRLTQPSKTRSHVERLVETLGTPQETPGEEQ